MHSGLTHTTPDMSPLAYHYPLALSWVFPATSQMYIVGVWILEFLNTGLSFQVQVLCTGSSGTAEPSTEVQDGNSTFGHGVCALTVVSSFPGLGLAR